MQYLCSSLATAWRIRITFGTVTI